MVCHSNHAVLQATDGMLAGRDAVCSQCHDPDSAGGKAAAEMAALMRNLRQKIEAADAILHKAQNSGMEVSDAIARQTDAHQDLVKARANVHAFAVAEVSQPIQAGLAVAAEDYRAGEGALHERNVRRIGLAVSLATILITMMGLWLTLRWIHSRRS